MSFAGANSTHPCQYSQMNDVCNIALYIDPPSHHFLKDQLFKVDDGRLNGDHILAPYTCLRDFFTSKGIAVHTADYMPPETNKIQNVYVSMGMLTNYRRMAKRRDTVLSAFFAMECPIVEPSLYRELHQVQRYFKRLFSWSDSPSLEHFVGGPLQLHSFRWPQPFDAVHETTWRQTNRKFLVMINANKLPRVYWQELYTERLRALEFFSRNGEIDLYGFGWNEPSYRVGKTWVPYSLRRIQRLALHHWQRFRRDPRWLAICRAYRGPAISKAETLGRYTFAICFENMVLKGWITEKIFDCFFAGTIPVYRGTPDITDYVPANCFIDMRNFSTYEGLRAFLKALRQKDIARYKENARAYLASEKFKPFSREAFVELFKKIVEEDVGISLCDMAEMPTVPEKEQNTV